MKPHLTLLACALGLAGNALAQSAPIAQRVHPPAAAASPRLEALIPPDPMGLWHRRLLVLRPSLALDDPAGAAYDAFVRALGDVAGLNEKRFWRLVGGAGGVVSGQADVQRDLGRMADESRDHAEATAELAQRWRELLPLLGEAQRAQLDATYGLSLREALARGAGGTRP